MVLSEANDILLGKQPINKAYIGSNLVYEKINAHLVDEWVFDGVNSWPGSGDTSLSGINGNVLKLENFTFQLGTNYTPLPGGWIRTDYTYPYSDYGLWFDGYSRIKIDLHALIGVNEPYTAIADIDDCTGWYQLTNLFDAVSWGMIYCKPQSTQRVVIGYSFDGTSAIVASNDYFLTNGEMNGKIDRYLHLAGLSFGDNHGNVIYRKLTLYKGVMTKAQINREIANRYSTK